MINYWQVIRAIQHSRCQRVLAVGISISAFIPGQNVPFTDQASLYERLRTTSGIVFGILGAWMVLVYPQELKNVFLPGKAVLPVSSPRLLAVRLASFAKLVFRHAGKCAECAAH